MFSKCLLNIYAYTHRLLLLSAFDRADPLEVGSSQFIGTLGTWLVSVKNKRQSVQLYLGQPFQLPSSFQDSENITEEQTSTMSELWYKDMTQCLKAPTTLSEVQIGSQETPGTLAPTNFICFSALSVPLPHVHATHRETLIHLCTFKT